MRTAVQRLRRDPGLALFVLALVIAASLYAPTLGRGLTNYDDPWLYADNAILQHPSAANVATVLTELDLPDRFTLGAEYLPVRDLSVMTDFAVWGEHYGGFHLTSVLVYLVAIGLWFAALLAFGVPRPIAGLALLLWAIHPAHVESVAWLAERKGVLGMMWSGACALAYARYRGAGRARWLIVAVATGLAAVWSKAIAAFAVASLAAIELVIGSAPRRRSITGLATIAVVTGLAYIPVVFVATRLGVVAGSSPMARPLAVLGAHGFYLRLVAGLVPNAIAYPLPGALDVVLGALGFVVLAVAFLPRWTARAWALPLRIAAVVWLFGWLPIGHLVLPIQQVFVADRYLLLPSLGAALALATAVHQLPRYRGFVIAALVIAFGARAIDAQASWRSNVELWHRAVTSDPGDANAWTQYIEALEGEGRNADDAVAEAFTHGRTARLVMHAGIVAFADGRPADGMALMTEAAAGGEPRAMANLANLLAAAGQLDRALMWARLATVIAPSYPNGHRIHGKVARLRDRYSPESLAAFTYALHLEPHVATNRYNLGIALVDAGRTDEGVALLNSCLDDRSVGPAAREALDHL